MVEYIPTKEMVGDFMTKPLQGELFHKLKKSIMGHGSDDTPDEWVLVQRQKKRGRKFVNDDTCKKRVFRPNSGRQECVGRNRVNG